MRAFHGRSFFGAVAARNAPACFQPTSAEQVMSPIPLDASGRSRRLVDDGRSQLQKVFGHPSPSLISNRHGLAELLAHATKQCADVRVGRAGKAQFEPDQKEFIDGRLVAVTPAGDVRQ